MKRKSILFTLITLILGVIMVMLCSCGYDKIERDFNKAGYYEVDDDNLSEFAENLKEVWGDKKEEEIEHFCDLHVMRSGAKFAIIAEFERNKDMEKMINDSETLKGLIKDIKKSDYVNGNCVLVYSSVLSLGEPLEIFKNA